MDWNNWVGPAVVAAGVSGIVSTVGMFINRSTVIRTSEEKINADSRLAERKFEFDKELAERRFAYEKQQVVFRRRFELAELVLADAYRFQELMKYVRNGSSFTGEGSTRESNPNESESLKSKKDEYFVPIERLQKEFDFLSKMMAKKYACAAHFGNEASTAYRDFNTAVHLVRTGSQALMQRSGYNYNNDVSFREKCERRIWEGMSENENEDEVGEKIRAGVAVIERLCSPVLTMTN